MRGITKKFGDFLANDSIDLAIHPGEVHALLGENGAGKTTLMNILYGLHEPTAGEILVRGKKVRLDSPRMAIAQGIGMVHQHFMLVENFTVAENIVLGQEPIRWPFFDRGKAMAEVERLSRQFGLEINPRARIQDISVGMQQRVEILKALYRGAEIFILDEPTAVLTPQEIGELGKIVRQLTTQGKAVFLITHKLKEIKAMADFCTVIRRGRRIATVKVRGVGEKQLAEMMVGREVLFRIPKKAHEAGAVLLRVNDLRIKDSRGLFKVNGLSFEVRSGEIFGLAGIDGNGQSELIAGLSGLTKIQEGEIVLGKQSLTNKNPRFIQESGLGLIPEDRQKRGLVLGCTVAENLVLGRQNRRPYSRRGLLNFQAITAWARRLIAAYDVRPTDETRKVSELSGGNQQKLIIAREVENSPGVLLAAQPTRGLDVGAIEFVHRSLLEQREKGRGILLVSLDLEEILSLSDRIGVIYEGRLVGIFDRKQVDEKDLGLLMAGGQRG